MSKIILIDTSTALCSAALCEDGVVTASRCSGEGRSHASLCAPFVDEILKERGLDVRGCDAVCVSAGPGSYTGLRVGVSTAKGLCFGGGLKLLSISTLDVLVATALRDGLAEGCKYIVPMIDARRMEVYSALYSAQGERLSEIEPAIIDEGSYAAQLQQGPVLFIGDGAQKCSALIASPNARFHQCCPDAAAMAGAAVKEYNEKRFKDIAYFEPFYLKQFVATVSSKKLF